MAALKIYTGAAFVTAVGKVFDGSAWKEKMKFHNGSAFVDLFGPTVTLDATDVVNVRTGSQNCWSGVTYFSDGTEKAATNVGLYTVSRGNWLDSGLNSQVWLERTINTGSLSTDGIGAGRVIMTSDHIMERTRFTFGISTCNLTIRAYDAASGGNLLSTATYLLSAEQTI